jgi:putative lipase involved disintegration of autophagic bodies
MRLYPVTHNRLENAKKRLTIIKEKFVAETWIVEELVENYLPLLMQDAEKGQLKKEKAEKEIKQNLKELEKVLDPKGLRNLMSKVLEA